MVATLSERAYRSSGLAREVEARVREELPAVPSPSSMPHRPPSGERTMRHPPGRSAFGRDDGDRGGVTCPEDLDGIERAERFGLANSKSGVGWSGADSNRHRNPGRLRSGAKGGEVFASTLDGSRSRRRTSPSADGRPSGDSSGRGCIVRVARLPGALAMALSAATRPGEGSADGRGGFEGAGMKGARVRVL